MSKAVPKGSAPLPLSDTPRPPAKRGLLLLGLLGVAVLLFLVTFSWQRRQWAEVARLDREARIQQTRLAALQQANAGQEKTTALPTTNTTNDVAARLNAIAQQVQGTGGGNNEATRAAAAQLRTLEDAALRSPHTADVLADLYQRLGYWDRAYAVARTAQERAPDNLVLLLRRGYIELALGRPAAAQTLFREAAGRAPDAPETHLALALAADQANDVKRAERELKAARRLRPSDWRILILLAQNLNAQRRSSEALQVLDEAERSAPAQPTVYATRATVLHDQARKQSGSAARFEPALTAARRWLTLDPNSRDAQNLLANILLESGNEAEAQRLWEGLYAVDPAYPKLRLNLGRLLVRRGDRARGLALLADERRLRDEAAEFNRLVILAGAQNENPAPHRQLARWCQAHGRLSRAILEWREVLARLPADAEAQAGLRTCLTLRGDPS